MKKILVIDNYDSFTYNLVEMIRQENLTADVFRNDEIAQINFEEYQKVVLSPGPGIPSEAGQLLELIKSCKDQKSILGVCLGMQGICEVFGAKLINMNKQIHGKSSLIDLSNTKRGIFKNLPHEIEVARYHSWIVDPQELPKEVSVTAKDREGNIMAIEHESLPLYGVQFHPESILTKNGQDIIKNFLTL